MSVQYYQRLQGRTYGRDRNPKIAVRFERDVFDQIEQMAREHDVAFAIVVRGLVDLALDRGEARKDGPSPISRAGLRPSRRHAQGPR